MKGIPKLRTPISYYGGKQAMAKHILPCIPEHKRYTEAFFGGGAVFFMKDPSEVETINDINGEVINFYSVITTDFWKLNEMIQSTLHSREQYDHAMVIYNYPKLFSPVQRAWAFWILTNQGFVHKIGAWGYAKIDSTSPIKISNKKLEFNVHIRQRLEHAQIECTDAIKVIESRDTEETFHYIDPPYLGTAMGHYGGYTESDYIKLLELLSSCKGKFLLSGFMNNPLKDAIENHSWNVRYFDKPLAASKDRTKRKIEVLVGNYDLIQK